MKTKNNQSQKQKTSVLKTENSIKESSQDTNTIKNHSCNVLVMPPKISDDDITALFNGILKIVKRKFELENNCEIINLNSNLHKLKQQLKEKQAECNRLKNEIIYLKSKLLE